MELQGKIIHVGLVSSGQSQRTGNTWYSQEAVLETQGQYPKHMAFTVFGEDRIKQFNLRVGMQANVQFDIDAHEYQGRWFNSITAYKVIDMEPQILQPQTAQRPENTTVYNATPSATPSDNADDLPF